MRTKRHRALPAHGTLNMQMVVGSDENKPDFFRTDPQNGLNVPQDPPYAFVSSAELKS